jgi:hypothetical protein
VGPVGKFAKQKTFVRLPVRHLAVGTLERGRAHRMATWSRTAELQQARRVLALEQRVRLSERNVRCGAIALPPQQPEVQAGMANPGSRYMATQSSPEGRWFEKGSRCSTALSVTAPDRDAAQLGR